MRLLLSVTPLQMETRPTEENPPYPPCQGVGRSEPRITPAFGRHLFARARPPKFVELVETNPALPRRSEDTPSSGFVPSVRCGCRTGIPYLTILRCLFAARQAEGRKTLRPYTWRPPFGMSHPPDEGGTGGCPRWECLGLKGSDVHRGASWSKGWGWCEGRGDLGVRFDRLNELRGGRLLRGETGWRYGVGSCWGRAAHGAAAVALGTRNGGRAGGGGRDPAEGAAQGDDGLPG